MPFVYPTMSLKEQFDLSVFNNKKVCVNERDYLNADFLFYEILDTFKTAQIISFYNSKNYYKKFTEDVQSYLDSTDIVQSDVQIIDDYHTAKKVGFIAKGSTVFYIFRTNSFSEKDVYLADYNIEIAPLRSGFCKNIDGVVKIYSRDGSFFEAKYKVANKHAAFFF